VYAAKPAASGFLPPGQGLAPTALATANLLWSAGVPFDQSGWIQEKCGRSGLPGVWFLGAPPVDPARPTGSDTCRLPAGTFLVVEAADVIASQTFGDGNTPKELRAAIDTAWPYLTDVEVTFDGQTMVNPIAYVATSIAVRLPANNLFGPDRYLTIARYYQFVTRPLSRGTHTLNVHYEWAPDWFGTFDRDYTIIAN